MFSCTVCQWETIMSRERPQGLMINMQYRYWCSLSRSAVLVFPLCCIGVHSLLYWCSLSVVLVFTLCCIGVPSLLHWCSLSFVLVSPLCCIGVSFLLYWCPSLLYWCFLSVVLVFTLCCIGVPSLLYWVKALGENFKGPVLKCNCTVDICSVVV